MVAPTLKVRVDWANDGNFSGALDDVSGSVLSKDHPLSWTRGRSADFSAEATGAATFVLRNDLETFTPDRNWHDNPSFEDGTTGWILSIPTWAAATSITQVVDNAPGAGTKAGELVLPATLNAFGGYPIPYTFRSGIAYTFSLALKLMSGASGLNVNVTDLLGAALAAGPYPITVTGSWVRYDFSWTPGADVTGVVVGIRTTSAAASTVRIDAVQVNPGSTANTYIEAPTKGQLVPGRPVHIYATYSAVDYPQFYGFIERLTPNPVNRTVVITCYDVLRRLSEVDVLISSLDSVRVASDLRRNVLADFERGSRNLLVNPSFETNVTGWTVGNGTLTRVTTDAASGTCSADFAWSSGTASVYQVVAMTPYIFASQVYRFSFYARVTAGTLSIEYGIGEDVGISVYSLVVGTATTTWQRFTMTWTAPTTRPANSVQMLRPFILLEGAGTLRIDGLSFTRGQATYPYADTGSGRWPNWVASGDTANGWHNGFTNLCTNSGFEVNATGWTNVTRVNTAPLFGSWHGSMADPDTAFFALAGTFKAGVTYQLLIWARSSAGASVAFVPDIGSFGTPADHAQSSTGPAFANTTYAPYTNTWTPSADRADARISFAQAGAPVAIYIDGVMVTRRDASSTANPFQFSDTGPGGGGSFITTLAYSATAKYGSRSLSAATPATATAGLVYDLQHSGGVIVSGQPYTLSVWLQPTSNMPYKVGLGANKGDGTWDEASTTGTATLNVWTQVTVTWTPSASYSSLNPYAIVLYVYQTDATARTFLVDGPRVIPASSADNYEMTQWSLPAEPDQYAGFTALTGSALAALSQLNGLTLSRHYIKAAMTTPWYTYVVSNRTALATKTSSETFDDDIADMSAADIDRASIINVVPIVQTPSGYTAYYSDATSVDKYGARPTTAIAGGSFFAGQDLGIGTALLARYKDPRARPVIKVENRWPSQLQRELDDLVTVNFARLRITGGKYLIQRLETTVSESAQHWVTTLALEEIP